MSCKVIYVPMSVRRRGRDRKALFWILLGLEWSDPIFALIVPGCIKRHLPNSHWIHLFKPCLTRGLKYENPNFIQTKLNSARRACAKAVRQNQNKACHGSNVVKLTASGRGSTKGVSSREDPCVLVFAGFALTLEKWQQGIDERKIMMMCCE